jgi:hypothetical protein
MHLASSLLKYKKIDCVPMGTEIFSTFKINQNQNKSNFKNVLKISVPIGTQLF